MKITAQNHIEASKQILRVICSTDYNQSRHKPSPYGYTYVYYSPESAYYFFTSEQRIKTTGLIKRYRVLDVEDIINTTAFKYSFAQIAVGAILSRKIMSYREFFDLARNNFDWLDG